MSSWLKRKSRLRALLESQGDEDSDGLAIDRILHGQNVIGRTTRTAEVDSLRFGNQDLRVTGTLERGQFGVADIVTCRLNGVVYIRKSVEKVFVLRNGGQCSPQIERDILLQATKNNSPWVPHLLCTFQTLTHLNFVMDFAEGGTLWDVLESSLCNFVSERDLRWWMPQAVSAIHWCHLQGFAHRDIKPHNFVLTTTGHVQLIDFGSAAPLLPPEPDGRRLAHENALVALEMDEDTATSRQSYGMETDWWSLGAMFYELAVTEITDHLFFKGIDWSSLTSQQAPVGLYMPQFAYSEPAPEAADVNSDNTANMDRNDTVYSQPFAFSAFFQSSSPTAASAAPSNVSGVSTASDTTAAFIGFTWGPTLEAFPSTAPPDSESKATVRNSVPQTLTPRSLLTPRPQVHPFSTPLRSNAMPGTSPLARTSTVRRTSVARRAVSDREAMRLLVDCVGMSARKKVLESGRKPRILTRSPKSFSAGKLSKFLPQSNYAHPEPLDLLCAESDSDSEDAPPSPSPSPRPGSSLSRRSTTPTVTMSSMMSQRAGNRFGDTTRRLSDASRRSGLLGAPLSSSRATPTEQANIPWTLDISSTPAPQTVRFAAASDVSSISVDVLEARHARLMRDILALQERIIQIATSVER
ncbi:kinase-like protein [Fistulina hepatica ATCC 64428]|uniref:non-specific serine/threonine protein kinase n=1 Tax=Fistulina hepatica ATCC 64428 TaxID=1128425 RepID=A0A0D7AA61_9AGAR|nr:kinase-like protein [Fistulina hepatica ATCC 64428]